MAGRSKGQPKTGGRKKGSTNKVTADIKALAGQHSATAVKELARLATQAVSEQARVAAIKELLDRAHGKPTQTVAGDKDNPVAMVFGWLDEQD